MPGYTQSMSWLKDLSHTGRRWLSQQLTLMCLSRMIRECISVGLSATRKVSDAGAAGILNPVPESSLMRGSPVKGFSDNKRH